MTLLFPGIVAGVVPAWIAAGRCRGPLPLGSALWLGLVPLAAGLVVLFATIWDFFAIGRGTLAPWDAPRALVHQRLYSRVRNPMYLGVLATIMGQALLRSSVGILIYLGVVSLAFHARVVAYEEPALAQRFGAAYAEYRRRVPRWVPRRRDRRRTGS